MSIAQIIARRPHTAVSVVASFFTIFGALWIAASLLPCGPGASRAEVFFCIHQYIAKFIWLALPAAAASLALVGAVSIAGFTSPMSCQKPVHAAGAMAVAGVLSYPVAAALAVLALRFSDPYWASVQPAWLFKRLVSTSFWLTWHVGIPGAAVAGGLSAAIVRNVTATVAIQMRPAPPSV